MEYKRTIRIAIVDDHQIVIDGLTAAFSHYAAIEIAATATDGHHMLELLHAVPFDVLLTDLVMPGITGRQLCAIVKAEHPQIAIIALSMNGDGAIINELISENLIDGYLLKYCGINELITAITTVGNGVPYFQREVLDELAHYDKQKNIVFTARLTNREKEIIALMEKDLSNKQIANDLNISIRTVETHRKNIFRKTNTNNLLTLVKWAYEHKILTE